MRRLNHTEKPTVADRDVNSQDWEIQVGFGESRDPTGSHRASNVAIVSIRRHHDVDHGFVEFVL